MAIAQLCQYVSYFMNGYRCRSLTLPVLNALPPTLALNVIVGKGGVDYKTASQGASRCVTSFSYVCDNVLREASSLYIHDFRPKTCTSYLYAILENKKLLELPPPSALPEVQGPMTEPQSGIWFCCSSPVDTNMIY